MSIIGIDLGTSATKIIEIENNNILNNMISNEKKLDKAFDIFVYEKNIDVNRIEQIVVTGVRSKKQDRIGNIGTVYVDEFIAIGEGAKKLSNKEKIIAVSVGTGTAFVKVEDGKIEHLGGTGVGGGTIEKLCKTISNTVSLEEIVETSKKGNLDNIDLKIKDITTNNVSNLTKNITACNFGKLKENATNSDKVLGVINMVFETIGVMASFLSKATGIKEIVLLGSILNKIDISNTLKEIEMLHNVKILIPQNANFGTIIGAIEYYKKSI